MSMYSIAVHRVAAHKNGCCMCTNTYQIVWADVQCHTSQPWVCQGGTAESMEIIARYCKCQVNEHNNTCTCTCKYSEFYPMVGCMAPYPFSDNNLLYYIMVWHCCSNFKKNYCTMYLLILKWPTFTCTCTWRIWYISTQKLHLYSLYYKFLYSTSFFAVMIPYVVFIVAV